MRTPARSNKVPAKNEFTVGWICALAIELTASKGMLDEIYPTLDQPQGDENAAKAPPQRPKEQQTCCEAHVRFGLMVGIGGGAPSANKPPHEDILLGDVVVSVPDGELGGAVKYDRGKALRNGVNKLRATHEAQRNALSRYVMEMIEKTLALEEGNPRFEDLYSYQGWEHGHLFEGNFPDLDELVSLCAGLLILNREGDAVQLVHYTTYDCLTEIDWGSHSKRQCSYKLHYISLIRNLNPLYTYVSANWGYHIRTSYIEEADLVLEFPEKEKNVSAYAQVLISSLVNSHGTGELPRELAGMHLVAYFGLEKAIIRLLARHDDRDSIDSYGQTPLFWAVYGEQEAAAKLLLSRGADPNLGRATENSLTPLLATKKRIAIGPFIPFRRATWAECPPIVKALLENHADPDISPLLEAVRSQNINIVKILLKHNADPNSSLRNGLSPLGVAVQSENIDIVELLLKHNADLYFNRNMEAHLFGRLNNLGVQKLSIYCSSMVLNPDPTPLQQVEI
ncbi:ankyrin repeat-containing domain protein [Aspergillus bertholletiae]|uniref:Ankyrin repeat-containing domain protein n=1 Tax=Aspergillus bertholletiae TaxID=1226010 RepID=A0A5N7B2K6_9EURO|nr:ankyrin repeat-containing domain protein [Aspergillus bertholletiae]